MPISSLSTSGWLHVQSDPLAAQLEGLLWQQYVGIASTILSPPAALLGKQPDQTKFCQHFCCFVREQTVRRTNVACLYAFNTICSISPASSLVSFTNPCPMVNSLGKVASTILSKSARFSPDLKRKTRQMARRHCKPAKMEDASFVLSSCTVILIKDGHLSGKS